MANRVIRGTILTSGRVNLLTWSGEVFYRRLMSVVDDFGRYDGRPSILRSALFPLRLDKVSEADIIKWMDECSKAELVSLYQHDNKPYLELLDFGQTLRIKKSKFPENKCKQMQADVCMKGNESESRLETESENLINGKILEILGSEVWLQNLARIEKIPTEKANELLVYFLDSQKNKEEIEHREIKEIKNHFANWLTKNKEKNSAKKENGTTTSKTRDTINGITEVLTERGIDADQYFQKSNPD